MPDPIVDNVEIVKDLCVSMYPGLPWIRTKYYVGAFFDGKK